MQKHLHQLLAALALATPGPPPLASQVPSAPPAPGHCKGAHRAGGVQGHGNTLDQPRPSFPPPTPPHPETRKPDVAEVAIPKCSHLQSRAIFHVLRAILNHVCKTGILIDGTLACVCVSRHLWWLLPLQHHGDGGLGCSLEGIRLTSRLAVCGGGAEPSGIVGGVWAAPRAWLSRVLPHTPSAPVSAWNPNAFVSSGYHKPQVFVSQSPRCWKPETQVSGGLASPESSLPGLEVSTFSCVPQGLPCMCVCVLISSPEDTVLLGQGPPSRPISPSLLL